MADCTRCQDTGVENWSGRIVSREQRHITLGPCLRCCWRLFWLAYDSQGNPAKFDGILFVARRPT